MPYLTVSNKAFPYLIALTLICSCASPEALEDGPTPLTLDIPEGFPEMKIPADNPMTVEAVAFGRELFFDPILSKDYSISCASCHFPAYAFSDTVPVSTGVHQDRLGNRNAYGLGNVGFLDALFMEGGVPSLELQVLAPMGERSEMDLQIRDAVSRMSEMPKYVNMAKTAYNREIDPWVITSALAAYQRTLISADSPFDRFYYGNQENAISEEAKAGWKHFQELKCNTCHTEPLFTDQGYFNIGLYEQYDDPGRGRLTDKPEDHGKFRVPSLRNVALTAPYMHDGSMESLSAVIEHFANGGVNHPNKSEMIKGFEIDEVEKVELIAFLESLTDSSFVHNKDHLPIHLR